MSFGQRLATLTGELVMECLSSGSCEVLLHCALCLCSHRLIVLRACETAGHSSSDEMWRWHEEEPVCSEVTYSHSSLLVCYHDCLQQVQLPPATSSSFLPGWKGLVCSSLHLVGWWQCKGVTGQLQLAAQGSSHSSWVMWDHYRKLWISTL